MKTLHRATLAVAAAAKSNAFEFTENERQLLFLR